MHMSKQRYGMCIYDMHGVTHPVKLKINTNLNMQNIKIELIIHLVSYMRILHQESRIERIL